MDTSALGKRSHCSGVHDGFELLVGHTRDGSFCCTCHPRHFRPRSPHWNVAVTCIETPTHMQLVKFALTSVVAPLRSAILCVLFFVQYFALLAARFGPGIDTVQSNVPLFPARNGDMLLKHQVITAYRSVIAISGAAPTMIDGIGNTRQRVCGHVCRVVGAVWLYPEPRGSPTSCSCSLGGIAGLSRGTSQTLRCTNKHILQLVHHQRSPADQVRQRVVEQSNRFSRCHTRLRVLRAAVAQKKKNTSTTQLESKKLTSPVFCRVLCLKT